VKDPINGGLMPYVDVIDLHAVVASADRYEC
jgi:hypothetical protein